MSRKNAEKGAISTWRDRPLNLVDVFINLGNNILSSESDVNMHLANP